MASCFTKLCCPHEEIAPGIGVPFEPSGTSTAVELPVEVWSLLLGSPEHTRLSMACTQHLLRSREHTLPLAAQGLGGLTKAIHVHHAILGTLGGTSKSVLFLLPLLTGWFEEGCNTFVGKTFGILQLGGDMSAIVMTTIITTTIAMTTITTTPLQWGGNLDRK